MNTTPLSPAEYYATLPKHIAGAGVILHDENQRILLVRPRYRTDTWEIPGGGLEHGEHPRQAAAREAREELGIDLTPGRLLAIDWVPAQDDGRPPLANFVFDAGETTQCWLEDNVHLAIDELAEWQLADAAQQERLLIPLLTRRLRHCASALISGSTKYLLNGHTDAELNDSADSSTFKARPLPAYAPNGATCSRCSRADAERGSWQDPQSPAVARCRGRVRIRGRRRPLRQHRPEPRDYYTN